MNEMMTEEHALFCVGDVVQISGLQTETQYNEKFAEISGPYLIDTKRWPITIKDHNQDTLAVKSVNLRRVMVASYKPSYSSGIYGVYLLQNENHKQKSTTQDDVKQSPVEDEDSYSLHFFAPSLVNTVSNCKLEGCKSLQAICQIMQRYMHYIEQIKNKTTHNIYEQVFLKNYSNIDLLNDYNHLLLHHCGQFEDIYIVLTSDIYCKNGCNLSECSFFQRNHRDRAAITKKENILSELYNNKDDITFEQLLDRVHCYLFHSFDTGYKIRKQIIDDIMNTNAESKSNDDEYYVNISQVNKRIRSQQTRQDLPKHMTTQNTKFINKTTTNNLNVYSYGFRYYYWEHYKNNNDIHDDAHRYSSKQFKWTKQPPICNADSTLGDWYIAKKYDNFKQELLKNALECIGLQQYNNLIEKAEIHIKTDNVRQIKCPRTISATYYEMKEEQSMNKDHLVAMMIYCNNDLLQQRFTETFRKIDKNETNQEIKQRHRNFYFLGRLLRESVECFGTKKRFGMDDPISVYQGVNKQFVYSSMYAYIKGPMSTTRNYVVAVNFCANQGIVVEIDVSDKNWFLCKKDEQTRKPETYFHVNYLDMSWISDYPNEQEIFFIGGLGQVTFNAIIEAKLGANYEAYIKGMKHMTYCMIVCEGGGTFIDRPETDKEIQMAYRLLSHELYRYYPNNKHAHEFKSCPEYIKTLLHLHCLSIKSVMFTSRDKSKLHDFIFKYDNGWIKLKLILTLFPNVNEIFYDDDAKLGEQHFLYLDILEFLSKNYQTISLKRIRFRLGDIDKTKDSEIAQYISRYYDDFIQYEWSLEMEIDNDLYGIGLNDSIPPIREVAIIMKQIDK
eukprot:186047_1